ncbi:hypothetical protein BV22DRAFT_1027457 [Leucogyrophana mollusca]|uniref:Uncharacterized protein n=1 Tax=Leucogyrophana mollusca TaxID=85980 RepID=A0ACB8BZZ4_9AGAM|nr:hypothetical protein BV22DRAFT_1027457 [Leucogyrophana mollusca]
MALPAETSSSPLQGGDPSPPRTQFCRWDWCRKTFGTHDQLVHHVVHDHVRKLKPMRKRDIALMRQVDAESIRSSSAQSASQVEGTPDIKPIVFLSAPTSLAINKRNSANAALVLIDRELRSFAGPPSSLQHTSPDRTGPRPITPPSARNRFSTPVRERPQESTSSSTAQAEHSSPMTTSPFHYKSFAQLSSPAGSISVPPLPQSPALSVLVDRSLHPSTTAPQSNLSEKILGRSGASRQRGSGQKPSFPPSLCHSQSSSLSSQEVERQLTQAEGMDVDDDAAGESVFGDGSVNQPEVAVASPTDPEKCVEEEAAEADSADPDAPDLQWPVSDDENDASVPTASTPIMQKPFPLEQPLHTSKMSTPIPPRPRKTGNEREFRSGFLEISPLATSNPMPSNLRPSHNLPDQPKHDDMNSSQDNSQASNSSMYSYPMVLQTQAPYQSQTFGMTQSQV